MMNGHKEAKKENHTEIKKKKASYRKIWQK